MNWTLIIALIGCATGVTSLIIQYRSHFLTRAKLKISLDQSKYSFFVNKIDQKESRYQSNCGATISLKISNPSAMPITVDEVKAGLSIKDKMFSFHTNENYLNNVSLKISDASEIYIESTKPLQIPYSIDPFHTIYASIKLPFFDELVNPENSNESIDFKLFINTPRKAFSVPVKIYEYKEAYQRRRFPSEK